MMNVKILSFFATVCVVFLIGCNGRNTSLQNEEIDSLKALEERLARLDVEIGELSCKVENMKFGYVDSTHTVVIPYIWDGAGCFQEGLAYVMDSSGKYGYIDKTGKVVIPCVWENASSFSEGLATVVDSTGKEGYIDKTGKVVIPCTFVRAYDFCGGMAAVNDSRGKFGFIDKTGKLVVPCVWDFTHGCFNDQGLAAVWDSTGVRVIDKTGAIVEWDTNVPLFK